MSYEVKLYTEYKDLPEEIKEDFDTRCFDEGRTVLGIYHNGLLIRYESDRGEPEDNSFYRDYSWIKTALEEAYSFGHKGGENGV